LTVRAAFAGQARACARLGSPFMHRLMNLAAERLRRTTPVACRVLDWPGDVSANGASVPLRLAAALHALVLTNTCRRLKDLWATAPTRRQRFVAGCRARAAHPFSCDHGLP